MPFLAPTLLAGILLAGCNRVPNQAPLKATDVIAVPAQASIIAVPVSADLGQVSKALEKAVPPGLWTIDKPNQVCMASTKVKVLFVKIKTPTIRCRIVGLVTRGPMAISGAGRDLVVSMPIHATISAKDIGGVLKRETAHADARVRAVIRLDVAKNWTPVGKVSISYDWTDTPHIDFLGRRIEFTSKADAKLQAVLAKLEKSLPAELEKLKLRDHVGDAWRAAFTSLQLNEANPAVWMRITPRELNYGGYTIVGRTLSLRLGMKAITETFVGPKPPNARVTSLPLMAKSNTPAGQVLFTIPVIADYGQLEPVLFKALTKRSLRPFNLPGLGAVDARFGKVTMYGTNGGKIAVGLAFTAARRGGQPSQGTVWLTALPVSTENSRRVSFNNLEVAGVTDSTGASLLIKLANAPALSETLANALTQNFSRDYDELLHKIGHAIAEKREGDLLIRAHIDNVQTGRLKVAGQGIYLPVWGRGTASVTLMRQ